MNFQELASERYSCRDISSRSVDPALIETIVATASKAPTAVNKQPIRIFRMQSAKAKEAVRNACTSTFGADTFLIVGYSEAEGWVRPYDNRPFADVDAAIVATHIMLQAADLGLATTWIGHFNAPLLKETFPEMSDYELIALFPIGYASESAVPSARHYMRKEPNQIAVTI